MKKLKLSACPLSFDLLVSTPIATSVVASLVCVRCPIMVNGHSYKVNLIFLPLTNLDIILEMD